MTGRRANVGRGTRCVALCFIFCIAYLFLYYATKSTSTQGHRASLTDEKNSNQYIIDPHDKKENVQSRHDGPTVAISGMRNAFPGSREVDREGSQTTTTTTPTTAPTTAPTQASRPASTVRKLPEIKVGGLQSTRHFCHSRDYTSTSGHRASCLFRGLCAVRTQQPPSPEEVKYKWGYDPNVTALQWLYVTEAHVPPTEMSFTFGVGPHSKDRRLHVQPRQLSSAAFQKQYPRSEWQAGLTVGLYVYNGENFGHALMDVMLPIFGALDALDLLDPEVHILRHMVDDPVKFNCDFQEALWGPMHLGRQHPSKGPGIKANCERFRALLTPMLSVHPMALLSSVVRSSTVPTCFDQLVVGMPMYSDDCLEVEPRKLDYWSLCNHGRQRQFWAFRQYTKANLGVPDVLPTEHHIVITRRTEPGRPINDLDVLERRLRQAYRGVRVSMVEWKSLSLQEQVALIGTATVHITPPGGISFIAVYLPRGATSIRLAHQAKDFKMEWNTFNYLGYITPQHVDCPNSTCPTDQVVSMVGAALQDYAAFGSAI